MYLQLEQCRHKFTIDSRSYPYVEGCLECFNDESLDRYKLRPYTFLIVKQKFSTQYVGILIPDQSSSQQHQRS